MLWSSRITRSPRAQAWKLSRSTGNVVLVDDLVPSGVIGLMDAIKGFDPDRGLRFATYATMRVRGAMLDWLRSSDWVPRLVRTRAAQMQRSIDMLTKKYGRPPTDLELIRKMRISFARLADIRRDVRPVTVESFETVRSRRGL